MLSRHSAFVVAMPLLFGVAVAAPAQSDIPKSFDDRLVVERFAASPDIVTPISMTCDRKGRLLVIESHTHFRPKDYKGPPKDRIRMFEDTKGTGKANRITTFWEGSTATMDIVLHPEGWVYVATRNEIFRLRDSKGDGVADEKERIVFLETKGDYPHNGLSGLCFDSRGDLYFGMGENIGYPYKLIGSDGKTLTGEGEGGNVFHCGNTGKGLRRVATGFWNPFGVCTDIYGRIFAVDNDPDAMPPCRMVHVVEGGDYGFQFRYGRSGRHPFQSWFGQLPGTLPMMSDVGEAPCKILSYESIGLPKDYLGQLLVASWADHRIERYVVSDNGASVKAERKPFIQGGKDFRPVGIAVAPDGSLFVSDWVLSDYNLHGKGAIWHIRMKEAPKAELPSKLSEAFMSKDRRLREWAARQLSLGEQDSAGRRFLREQVGHADVRIRAAAITALINVDDDKVDLHSVAEKDSDVALRAMVMEFKAPAWGQKGNARLQWTSDKIPPAVRREAITALTYKDDAIILRFLKDDDPFIRQAMVRRMSIDPDMLGVLEFNIEPRQRQHLLLAFRGHNDPKETAEVLPKFLADADEEVRFLAAKWIADDKLTAFRPQVEQALKDPKISVRLYLAFTTALARINNEDVSEARMAEFFFTKLTDPTTSPALRIAAMRLIAASHKKLTLDVLTQQLKHEDPAVQLEAVRLLNEHPDGRRVGILLDLAKNSKLAESLRAHALLGIGDGAQEHLDTLMTFAKGDQPAMRAEAIRALTGTKLSDTQRKELEGIGKQNPAIGDLVARVLGQPFAKDRPKPEDTAAWLKRLEGPADAEAGHRVFYHAKLGYCSRCHRIDGRGADIGPDLSGIGRTERRHIVESIFQPSLIVAPNFQSWAIETADGKTYTAMLVNTKLDVYTYVDAQGKLFNLNTRDIVDSRPIPTSIMPAGLPDLLTDQELRDLLAYLTSRR
jgi:putative membrane-bound dehydrogenase-like protein